MDKNLINAMVKNEDSHPWWMARLNFLDSLLTDLDREKTRILDFGCGSGGALERCKNRGFVQIIGMDTSEICIEAAQKRGLTVKKISTDIPSIPARSYDVILLLDVLEHLEKDSEYLRVFENALTPGGFILLTVPANRFLWSFHDVANQHYRRYSKSSLKKTLAGTNLNLIEIRWWNSIFFVYTFVVRKILRKGNHVLESEIRMPPRFLVPLIYKILIIEQKFHFLGKIPGVSLVAVLQKQIS
jgi:SAM-dependent methyltransferase